MTDEPNIGMDHPTTQTSVAEHLLIEVLCDGCGNGLHEIEYDEWPVTFEWSEVEIERDGGEIETRKLVNGIQHQFCSQACWRDWVQEQVNGETNDAIFVEGELEDPQSRV